MSNKPRYFAVYSGPSYGGWDGPEYVIGLSSLKEAKDLMRQFDSGYVTYDEYLRNPDGLHVPWRMRESFSLLGSTSWSDRMDVYEAIPVDVPGQYLMGDFVYRLTYGERGGVKVEK